MCEHVIAFCAGGLNHAFMARILLIAACFALTACAQAPKQVDAPEMVAPSSDQLRPKVRPAGLGRVVPKEARTVEEFDVTTAQEREEAAAVPVATVEKRLGLTVASLGDPTQAGFWIKTPLVSAAGKGRVVYPGTGKSVQVYMTPIEGSGFAGSRLSLAAFRLIEAPLTELPEVEVFSGG